VTAIEDRRAAVRAQLAALTEHELRLFVEILAIDVEAVEVPLAEFLAERAGHREQAAAAGVAGDLGSSRDMLALLLALEAGDDGHRAAHQGAGRPLADAPLVCQRAVRPAPGPGRRSQRLGSRDDRLLSSGRGRGVPSVSAIAGYRLTPLDLSPSLPGRCGRLSYVVMS
jgi:hypothetical protein